jgi:hypothetical protein
MSVVIEDLRPAWIWLESFPGSLTSPLLDQVAGCSLIDAAGYQGAFGRARSQPAPGPFAVPWDMSEPERIQWFWTYYFENSSPHQVLPQEAWRKLVPLRRPAGVTVTAPWLPGYIRFHAFHYPHALALVALAGLQADLSLVAAVNTAQQISRGGVFDATFADGKTGRYTLPALASQTLDRLSAAAFGADVLPRERSLPFSLATVVRAQGNLDVHQANPENGAVHQALDGLCRDHAAPPEKLQQAVLATRRANASHLFYGLRRSRAVWYPTSFLPNPRRQYTLGCYHHNLLFATLQTESLLALLGMADRLGDLNKLSPSMQRLVRAAAGIVGLLYGGNGKCYRSQSPRRQIDDSGQVPAVNRVRLFYGGMDPLKR